MGTRDGDVRVESIDADDHGRVPPWWRWPWLRPAAVVGVAAVAAYGWWATGVPPFTARTYLAVGVPVALLAIVNLSVSPNRSAEIAPPGTPPPGGMQLRSTYPWLLLLVLAVGLEGAGLALGGRSAEVPTLSTVVDHTLGSHLVRFVLFCAWLGLGWAPVVRALPSGRGRTG